MEIVKEINTNELEVTLIAGYINAVGKTLFWKYEEKNEDLEYKVGDYAIVENNNGFDLIKIVGIVKTKRNYTHKIANTIYTQMKNVKGIIHKEYVK